MIPFLLRTLLAAAALAAAPHAFAHHPWGDYRTDQVLYLEGRIAHVDWRFPHVEAVIEMPPGIVVPDAVRRMTLPPDVLRRSGAPSDLAVPQNLEVPRNAAGTWTLVISTPSFLERAGLQTSELRVGDSLAVIGFPSCSADRTARPQILIMASGKLVPTRTRTIPRSCSGARSGPGG
jgi:hypothetical protein